jgi:hypothetical protein
MEIRFHEVLKALVNNICGSVVTGIMQYLHYHRSIENFSSVARAIGSSSIQNRTAEQQIQERSANELSKEGADDYDLLYPLPQQPQQGPRIICPGEPRAEPFLRSAPSERTSRSAIPIACF